MNDPAEVVIDFKNARVKDHSALEAIDLLAERYTQLARRFICATSVRIAWSCSTKLKA